MANSNTYKQTAIGLIPTDWEVKKIEKVVETISIPYKYQTKEYLSEGLYPIIDQGKSEVVGYTFNSNHLIKDLPVVLFGDHTKILKYINYPFCVGADGTKLLKAKLATSEFLFYVLDNAIHKLPDLSYSRHFSELKNIVIPIPPLPEQQKIAVILSAWDVAIDKTSKIILELRKRKNGLATELLSGRKRFIANGDNILIKNKGFVIPQNWRLIPLLKLVKPIKNSVIPEKSALYKQIGIRSHAKGIFYKEEVSGLSLGNKSVFKIEPDCFIVNIVFAWEHAIAKTTVNEVGMIASHRFPMYKPIKGELNLDYLLHFFKSKKGKDLLGLASPGGAGRNKTLGQSEFLKLQIPVPNIEEQIKIATCLDMVDEEIVLYQKKLAELQLQKKGLMQQLLTGKVRVKIN